MSVKITQIKRVYDTTADFSKSRTKLLV